MLRPADCGEGENTQQNRPVVGGNPVQDQGRCRRGFSDIGGKEKQEGKFCRPHPGNIDHDVSQKQHKGGKELRLEKIEA